MQCTRPSADPLRTKAKSAGRYACSRKLPGSATSRVFVPESVWPEFSSKLKNAVSSIRQSDVSTDLDAFMGAVINEPAWDRVTKAISRGISEGATIVCGGGSSKETGWFVEPTVLLVDRLDAYTMTNEVFGPVVTCMVYPDAEWREWLQKAGDSTAYALTGTQGNNKTRRCCVCKRQAGIQ